jgi:hypothetical protein
MIILLNEHYYSDDMFAPINHRTLFALNWLKQRSIIIKIEIECNMFDIILTVE